MLLLCFARKRKPLSGLGQNNGHQTILYFFYQDIVSHVATKFLGLISHKQLDPLKIIIMDFFISSSLLTYILWVNFILWIITVFVILKTKNNSLNKLLQFLTALFLPFLGSLFVLMSISGMAGINNKNK